MTCTGFFAQGFDLPCVAVLCLLTRFFFRLSTSSHVVTVVQMSIPFLLVPLDSAPYFRASILGVLTFATVCTGLSGTFPHYIGTAGIEPATTSRWRPSCYLPPKLYQLSYVPKTPVCSRLPVTLLTRCLFITWLNRASGPVRAWVGV